MASTHFDCLRVNPSWEEREKAKTKHESLHSKSSYPVSCVPRFFTNTGLTGAHLMVTVNSPFRYLELALSSSVLRKKIIISLNDNCFSFKELYEFIAKRYKKKENKVKSSFQGLCRILSVIVCCARC